MKIAIVDDDNGHIEYLSALVDEWAKNTGETVQLSAFESAEAFLYASNELL